MAAAAGSGKVKLKGVAARAGCPARPRPSPGTPGNEEKVCCAAPATFLPCAIYCMIPVRSTPRGLARLKAIQSDLEMNNVLELLVRLRPNYAPLEWVERLHDPAYVQRFKEACEQGQADLWG